MVAEAMDQAAAALRRAGLTEGELVQTLMFIAGLLASRSAPAGTDAWRREREGRWPDPEPPEQLFGVPVGGVLNDRDRQQRWRREPDGPGGQTRGTLLPGAPEPLVVEDPELASRLAAVAAFGPLPYPAGRPAAAPVTEAPAAPPVPDDPGELPAGSVVTDTRMRVCWRDDAGWHRADTDAVLSWADVCRAVGGPEGQPLPGQPTVVSQPPRRAQGPTVVRAAGSLQLPMQVPVVGPDGEPLLGPDGRKLLRTETETVGISEVVPAGGGA